MERLIKNEILHDLDFTNLNIYVDCIKGKQTKHTKKGATRSIQLLEIMHIDICGPFDVNSFEKKKILYHLYWWLFTLWLYLLTAWEISGSGCLRNLIEWSRKTIRQKGESY